MKLDRDVVGCRTIATPNSGKPPATHSERSRGFDLMVSSMLLALLIASIAMGDAASDEFGGANADRSSYFASAVDFVVNFSLSIGLTWLLLSCRPHENDERKGP
jgi:hypothetical protein